MKSATRSNAGGFLRFRLDALRGSISGKPTTAPCDAPVALSERPLSDRDVEVLWGLDRSAWRECGTLFAFLGGFRRFSLRN